MYDELPVDVPEILGDIPVLEYRQLGSRALAKLVGDAPGLKPNTRIMVLLNHGVIGVGACSTRLCCMYSYLRSGLGV